jgi:hypothetical protein
VRFIYGLVVGAALVVGGAWLHDTGALKFGPSQPFVNWDNVSAMLR